MMVMTGGALVGADGEVGDGVSVGSGTVGVAVSVDVAVSVARGVDVGEGTPICIVMGAQAARPITAKIVRTIIASGRDDIDFTHPSMMCGIAIR